MGMNESEDEAEYEHEGCEEKEFPKACLPVAGSKMKIETGARSFADGEESIEAGIDEKQFIQGVQAGRPGAVEPAQVDSQAEHEEDECVAPIAALVGVRGDCMRKQPSHSDRKERVHGEPIPTEDALRQAHKEIGRDQNGGNADPHGQGPAIDHASHSFGGEAECDGG